MPQCTVQGSKIGRLCILSGTIVCAVEDETQKARCENILRRTDVHTDKSEGDMKKKNSAHLGEKLPQGFSSCAPRFGLSMLFNAIFKKSLSTYIAKIAAL